MACALAGLGLRIVRIAETPIRFAPTEASAADDAAVAAAAAAAAADDAIDVEAAVAAALTTGAGAAAANADTAAADDVEHDDADDDDAGARSGLRDEDVESPPPRHRPCIFLGSPVMALASTEEHRRALAHFWLCPPLVTDIHNPDAELP